MNLSIFKSFFPKEKKKLTLPESLLIKKLKSVAHENNLLIYENITIYHHAMSYYIPLIILDTDRGIYLFEHKEWSYDELKSAKVEKATSQTSSSNTLAFEKSHEIIRQRFNELTHDDGVPIFNYLLMENLNADEYEHLDVSFQKLLPKHKVMFSNSSDKSILQKLENSPLSEKRLPRSADIIGSILVQHCITDNNNQLNLCSAEQMNFINATITGHSTLKAPAGSGKTNALLLKVILEKLQNEKKKIIIIKPTILSCDILKKKLLNIIEHAIIEIDLTTIEIITPVQLINKHLEKLSKPLLENSLFINQELMTKRVKLADTLFCDDADLLPSEFISYLKFLQEKSTLLLVSNHSYEMTYEFTHSFRLHNQKQFFIKTNPHAKAMQLISKALENSKAEEIVVVSNSLSKEKLNDDLEYFISNKALLLDSSKNLINQNINNLLLSTYNDLNGINAKTIILLDICHAPHKELLYSFTLADESVYLLYEDECEQLNNLRN